MESQPVLNPTTARPAPSPAWAGNTDGNTVNPAGLLRQNVRPVTPRIAMTRVADIFAATPESDVSKKISQLGTVQLSEQKNHVYTRGWCLDQPLPDYPELVHRPSSDAERQRSLSGNLVYQYYCHPDAASKRTNFQDWTDAISIGFNTCKEYLWSLLTRRDSFFITPWYTPEYFIFLQKK